MGGRDAEATRGRILAAAVAEFAAHGLSGGRVDRIAAGAGSNVRMIYAYFGGKTALFDAALAEAVLKMSREVPPRAEDPAGWAGEVFDFHQRDPAVLRLCQWAQLERPEAASEPLEVYSQKAAAFAGTGSRGFAAVDLLVIIYAIAQAWQLAPSGLLAADPAADARSRRSAVVSAVARIVAGSGSPTG
ncbi:TetR family transcriptional regulator [Agromyces sp. NPDC058110]|uniref:TetR family transcriptional regulator n=1 Tax=Agromyces sp. NPDC058110 TaxID=3346345 RepID=UPI0036DB7164